MLLQSTVRFTQFSCGFLPAAKQVLGSILAFVWITCGAFMIMVLIGFNGGGLQGFFDNKLYYKDGKVYLESDSWFTGGKNVEVYESKIFSL